MSLSSPLLQQPAAAPRSAVARRYLAIAGTRPRRFAAVFLQVGYFFLLPLLAILQPEFEIAGLKVNSEMIAGSFIAVLFGWLAMSTPAVLRLSPLSKALLAYNAYFLVNPLVRGVEVTKTDAFLIVASTLTIIVIENAAYKRSDLTRLLSMQRVMAGILLLGTVLQVAIDPALFVIADRYEQLSRIDFEGFWRYGSIFDSMMENQSGIAFIILTIVLAFYREVQPRIACRAALAALLVVGFLSYSRYIILLQVIGLVAAVAYRVRGDVARMIWTVFTAAVIGVVGWLAIGATVADSDFYNVRLLADVSGRTSDPLVFLTTYLPSHPLLFGTGFSSFDVEYFYPGLRRVHAGIWDLLFQGGVVGLTLFGLVLYQMHRWALAIQRRGGSAVYLLVAPCIIAINLTARLNTFIYWGYFLAIYGMALEWATLTARPAVRQSQQRRTWRDSESLPQ